MQPKRKLSQADLRSFVCSAQNAASTRLQAGDTIEKAQVVYYNHVPTLNLRGHDLATRVNTVAETMRQMNVEHATDPTDLEKEYNTIEDGWHAVLDAWQSALLEHILQCDEDMEPQ